MEKVVSLCKRRGFIFPGSEIYGGLANTWDYGPYGVLLKNNIKQNWWKTFVQKRDDIVGLDSGILMNPKIWEASGHVASFTDPLIDCKKCKQRYRGDKLLEAKLNRPYPEIVNEHLLPWISGDKRKPSKDTNAFNSAEALEMSEFHKKDQSKVLLTALPSLLDFYEISCPSCGSKQFTDPRLFNLMFKTFQGVIEDRSSAIYLRPETAQGIFVNFKNVVNSMRKKLPFGIAQIGKAFRNEITPGNFIFRTREFEQMEIEYFINPENYAVHFDNWVSSSFQWFESIGIKKDNMRIREHTKEELSHYSSLTKDIEYSFPFGWGELEGIAYRSNYDLTQHQKFSGEDLSYIDPYTHEKMTPHAIEPSFGVDRTVLTVLLDAYHEEEVRNELRVVLRLNPLIAPVRMAVLPLSQQLEPKARELYEQLSKTCDFKIEFDAGGSIGKRYRRQDEIGTPQCITFDFDSLEDKCVTIRDRDTMEQKRMPVEQLLGFRFQLPAFRN